MSYNPASGGDVAKVGTPVNNQVGIWTGDGTLEGDTELIYDGSELTIGGNLSIPAAALLYLDGGGNTYITESPTNTFVFVGNGFSRFSCSTATFATQVNQIQFGGTNSNVTSFWEAGAGDDCVMTWRQDGNTIGRLFANGGTGEIILDVGALTAQRLRTTGTTQFIAPTTARASIGLPHGTAPTTPVDGDMWTTTAGLFVRINGVTVGPLS